MVNIIEEIKNQIDSVVASSIKKLTVEYNLPVQCEDVNFIVEQPREKNHGDYATNAAMLCAKIAKKAPRDIALMLTENMDFSDTYILSADIAGPGFINFKLKSDWLFDAVCLIEEKGTDYGKQDIGKGEKIMIEYVSANPTGPMHMGNARGGALGDSLASVLGFCGYNVTREFYLNDAGNQIEKLGKSLEARYIQLLNGEDAVEFPEDGYHGEDIWSHMKNLIGEEGDKYLNVPSDERKKVFIDYVLEKNVTTIVNDLTRYRINYDVWFRESALYTSGDVKSTIELLKQSGYTYEQEDALWFKSTEFGLEKDDVLVRNNGIPTYFAVDIAYHRNKFLVRGFDKVVNIWGADHHGHVARMKGAMQAIGVNPDRLDVILMQLVRLVKDGIPVKMSKRTGKMITLSDLLDDIGVDATRYFFNLRQADSHFDFDLDLAAEQSNENPVFYVQYAHARICSILKRLQEENIIPKKCAEINLNVLIAPEETELIKALASYPEELRIAALSFDPTRLTRYTYELASAFHTFYNACHVKGDDENLMYARLKLAEMVKNVIFSSLALLNVSAPEKM